ncbi:unnamed protein product [Allacma fusca]|uniref:Uncharacterized protein n=1 Tax=Allacma fusca TaxID=39272 RepID=A0A8J2KN97_9HEXA|nr:unnamed protein product [Allacma fusca]
MLVLDSTVESSKGIMPFVRRKRTHSASLRNNQVEAEGLAWLCFADDHSWFQGNINTEDESNYSLYGTRYMVPLSPTDEEDESGEERLEDQLGNLRISTRGGSCGESTESSSDGEPEPNNNTVPKGLKSSSSKLTKSSCQEYYNVTLTDHFSGLRYQLPRITVNKQDGQGKYNLFHCSDGQITFEVQNIFKGQKADMMIQQHIGSPSLLGQKCLVYTGPMNIVFNDVLENGRSWCL